MDLALGDGEGLGRCPEAGQGLDHGGKLGSGGSSPGRSITGGFPAISARPGHLQRGLCFLGPLFSASAEEGVSVMVAPERLALGDN